MWKKCPHSYKLKYIDKKSISTPNIYALFGTAMHETIQEYLRLLYNVSVSSAMEFDYAKFLRDSMAREFLTRKEEIENKANPASKEEMLEFWNDGIAIMKWLMSNKNRLRNYSTKGWELVDVELLVEHEIRPNVFYIGYLDIVFKSDDGKYKIIDFKTSTKGWGKWAKKDKLKSQQLVLYKWFYSDRFGVPIEDISVEFHILKRKLYEDLDFVQYRIQKWSPSQGIVTVNRAKKDVIEFVEVVFDEEGNRRTDIVYPKTPGKNKKNCKWCEFSNPKLGLCDKVPTKP